MRKMDIMLQEHLWNLQDFLIETQLIQPYIRLTKNLRIMECSMIFFLWIRTTLGLVRSLSLITYI
nr:MAG TPA: hypothetical protein [Caudoviricetes sp.]